MEQVPEIDFAPFLAGNEHDKRRVAREIGAACEGIGFFYLIGHDVSDDVTTGIFAAAREFFALPHAVRHHPDLLISPEQSRGYQPIGARHYKSTSAPDLMEAFKYQRELPPDDPEIVAGDRIQQLNKWPADRPLWRKTLLAYFDAIDGVSYDLLRAFALALDVEEDYFHRFYRKPSTQVSLLHYPPQQPADKAFGNRPHADETAFTINLQETVTGLEVRTRSGEWVSAPPVDGSFVVNIGDYMARWTNGRFRSTLHRVVNRTGNERYSIPYFAIPNFDAEIGLLGAVSTCPGGDRGAKHSSGQVQCHSLKIEIYKPADDALESWQSSTLNAYSRNPRPRLTERKEEGIDTYVRLRSIRKEWPVRLPTLSWHHELRRARCRPARPLDPIPRQRTADLQGRHGSGPVLFRLRQQLRYGCVGARCRRATP